MNSAPSIFVVGTNTEIGKTHFLELLLLQASQEGVEALPFKPAQSGNLPPEQSDAGRLCRAKNWDLSLIPAIAPWRFDQDLAPGCAQDPKPFTQTLPPDPSYLRKAESTLQALVDEQSPDFILCEGAGGLHVPMPGGTWQSEWIKTLATHLILVAPTGLGTINHSLLTIQALQPLNRPILGIAWTAANYPGPNLAEQNMQIVEHQTGLPALARPTQTGTMKLTPNLATHLKKTATQT